MEFGKAAASTFGPTSAAIYAGFVEGPLPTATKAPRPRSATVRSVARQRGLAHPRAAAIGQLTTRGPCCAPVRRNAVQNAAEDVGHQMVDSAAIRRRSISAAPPATRSSDS